MRVADPAEVRLDLLLEAADGTSWVLVEVQLDQDKAKARKWPLAVAALWNERAVEGDLIVFTADRGGDRLGEDGRGHDGRPRNPPHGAAGRRAAYGRR